MKQRMQCGTWLFISAAALALILVFLPGDPTLIQQSKRVATLDAVLRTHCLWVTDHTAIYLRYRRDDSGYELARIDTLTGKVTPMEALNRKYSAMMKWPGSWGKSFNIKGERISYWMPLHGVSSDGKWLVFSTPTTRTADRTHPGSFVFTTLDGTKELRWQAGTFFSAIPLWMQDGHRWVEPIYELKRGMILTAIVVHDLDRPQVDKSLPVVGAARNIGVFGVTVTDQLAGTEWFRHGTGMPVSPAEFVTCDVPGLSSSAPGNLHRYQVNLPEGTSSDHMIISPHGDRLAWHLTVRRTTWIDALIHRILPSKPLRSDDRQEIWVSNLDGSHMTRIGYNSNLFQVQWLPGGKQLSFLYRDGLYTVPVP